MKQDKRKQRLTELIKRMNDGLDVSLRDMKIVLTDHEHAIYLEMWEAEKAKRNPDKPKSVIAYEKLINQLHMVEARLSKYSRRINKNPRVYQKMINSIDGYYETIQEYLMEHRHDGEFNMWLDRDNRSPDPNMKVSLDSPSNDLYTPALLITSRSLDKKSSGLLSRYTKRDIKKMVLESALSELELPSESLEKDDVDGW